MGQRLEFYVGNDDDRYPSRIEDLTEEEILVAMPVNSKRVPVIPARGEHIYALAVGERCRYRFFAICRGTKVLDGNIPVLVLSRPDTVDRFQNRRFVRIKMSQQVRVTVINEDGSLAEPVLTYTIDLSGSGICFVMKEPVKVGLTVSMFIFGVPDGSNMDVLGEVIRSDATENAADERIYHVGVKFKHLSRPVVNRLVHYLFGVQRKYIAKGVEIYS